jgi:hypothetical protein
MKIGSADLYANHPIIVVGSDEPPNDDLELGEAAAVASERHVMIATRGQAALTRVTVWKEVGPRVGKVVFSGELSLREGFISVADVECLSTLKVPIGTPNRRAAVILVDDPGWASRVDMVVDAGPNIRSLTAVPGLPIFDVSLPASGEFGPSDELGLILSGHDIPVNRLAAAIKLIAESSAARPAIKSFRIRMVVEWVRWLSPELPLSLSRSLGAYIEERLAQMIDKPIDEQAAAIATEVLQETTSRRDPG